MANQWDNNIHPVVENRAGQKTHVRLCYFATCPSVHPSNLNTAHTHVIELLGVLGDIAAMDPRWKKITCPSKCLH